MDKLTTTTTTHSARPTILTCSTHSHSHSHDSNNSLNVSLDIKIHEVNVRLVLLAVGEEGDERLRDGVTHPLPQTVHVRLMKTNGFQEWRLRPEQFVHYVLRE